MHWYDLASQPVGFNKTAATGDQDGSSLELFDTQRYKMDSYLVNVALSQTGKKIGVTLVAMHEFTGSIGWDEYWIYDLSEHTQARSTYQKIVKATEATIEEFVASEIPSSIFWPTLRSKVEGLDKTNQTSTNIPHINYAKDVAIAPDWRSNIYGTKYPAYDESNYAARQALMKRLYPNNY